MPIYDPSKDISPGNMPPFEACEEMPQGLIPPLKRNELSDHFTGQVKDYVENFKREMPGELMDKLMMGIVKVDHQRK